MSDLNKMTTEAINPASDTLDQMTARELVDLINREDQQVAIAVREEAEPIAHAVATIADRLRKGGRLVYIGAGTSGRLGVLDASECPPTFNSDPRQVIGLIAGGDGALRTAIEGAEDFPEYAVKDLQSIDFSSRDVLVGIATSGRTPYVIGGLRYAQEIGAYAIGLACNAESQLATASDLVICPIVGPEVITGSTRMKAGTATKLVLNTLTTGAMVLLGKTYGNLMVDLRASNVKLRDRSARLVCKFTGISREAAEQVLEECEGKLKVAVVRQLRGITPDAAAHLLEQANGHLRSALEAPLSVTTRDQ